MVEFLIVLAAFNHAGAWTWCALYLMRDGGRAGPSMVLGFLWPLMLLVLLFRKEGE